MVDLALAWFLLMFSMVSLCWFGSGWSRIYDCRCRRYPQRVVILRPTSTRVPGADMETGYYVPAATFDEYFGNPYVPTSVTAPHFENVNETAIPTAGPSTSTSTTANAADSVTKPGTNPPTYIP